MLSEERVRHRGSMTYEAAPALSSSATRRTLIGAGVVFAVFLVGCVVAWVWWQDAEVPLFNILVHLLAETSRHAGHADILREVLDGVVGTDAESMAEEQHDPALWAERREEIEVAARSAR